MADNKNGPEFAPLRDYISHFPIVVRVYRGEEEIPIREERMDYGKIEDKKHLGKLSFWAWENGYVVETQKA